MSEQQTQPGKQHSPSTAKPFLTDVAELRRRASENIEQGAVTNQYEGDADQAIELLQTVLATEMVCVMRYTMHAIAAQGIDASGAIEQFEEHAASEKKHELMAANRIDQLGGVPNYNPEGLAMRSATQYTGKTELVEMIKEDLIAERIVIEHYNELIRWFGEKDITTRRMLESILEDEEDHATDMHDLLVAHQGQPFLSA